MKFSTALLGVFLSIVSFLSAAEPEVIPLWPAGMPTAPKAVTQETLVGERIFHVQTPTLTRFAAAKPVGTAVVFCPGGGYDHLSPIDGGEFTRWLNGLGVDVFVLKYRLVEYGHPAPLQDVLQALRIVRSRAAEFHVRVDRIGVFGGSAGGHLAASAGTLYAEPSGKTGGPLDAISARPDFLMLLYPVITMKPPFAHEGSRRSLLGADPSPAMIELLSLEDHVTPRTPPAFLVHTAEDGVVALENSVAFYLALKRAGVPAELHLYQHGLHGFGVSDHSGTTPDWSRPAETWLRSLGLLSR